MSENDIAQNMLEIPFKNKYWEPKKIIFGYLTHRFLSLSSHGSFILEWPTRTQIIALTYLG